MADEGGDGDKLVAQPPTDLGKSLRCCVPCRLVKTFEQFYEQVGAVLRSVGQDGRSVLALAAAVGRY